MTSHKIFTFALIALNAALAGLIVYSCGRESRLPAPLQTIATSRSVPDGFQSFNINFPPGTNFDLSGNVLRFDLPEPYYILGIDENGTFYRSEAGGGGSVTCECNQGSGCDPIKNGDDYGCLMKSGCSKCTKSTSSIIGVGVALREIIVVHPEHDSWVNNFSKLNGQYLLPPAFVDSDEVANFVAELRARIGHSQSTARKVIFINMYGYIVPIEVPDDGEFDTTSVAFVSAEAAGGAGVTCSCNVSGSCPKESKWGVIWCNSDGCTKCTMSGRVVNPQGEELDFTSEGGRIVLQ